MRKIFFLLAVSILSVSVYAQEAREYIIVSGAPALMEWEKFKDQPRDIWWGNFIRAARVRIQQIQKEQGNDAAITWFVYRPGYVRRAQRQDRNDLLGNITSVRDTYGIKLVWFSTTQELVDYLNAGQPRDRVKIANFEIYSHSNCAAFMFDYSNEIDAASKVWWHEKDLHQIHRGIFARDAFIKSWGCHTGESFSKKWRAATGTRMIGAVGKTNYANGHLRGWVPALNPKGRWTR